MKTKVFKVLPIVVGVGLGWLLMAAPDWLRGIGPARYFVVAAGVAVLLVAFVAATIVANLPADIPLDPWPTAEIGALAPLLRAYESAGYLAAGAPLRAGVAPPALLVPLVHRDGRSYATVFRTGTVPPKTSYDVVSILAGGRGGLTTSPTPAGATLPAAPGQLRQVFPGAAPAALAGRHGEALRFLEASGVRIDPVTAQAFQGVFKAAVARQRADFLRHPLRGSIVAIWRSATKLTPHSGPIEKQPLARRRIAELATGRRA